MNIQQVRYFLAVAETKNFRRAAQRCNVAQPSVTNAIKALERELGGALFVRTRPVKLTELGSALLPYFERIGREVEALGEMVVEERRKAEQRALVIAIVAPATNHLLEDMLPGS